MSYKAPSNAVLKKLSFIVTASGDGGTGAYDSANGTATAFKVTSSQTHMRVTDDGKDDGNSITLPSNVLVIGYEIVTTEAFTAYSTYSDGGDTGSSASSLSFDYTFGKPKIYYGTTWSNVNTHAHSSAGTLLPLSPIVKDSSGSASIVDPYAYTISVATYSNSQHAVVGTGGVISLGLKGGSSYYGSIGSSTQNDFCASGKVEYKIYYKEL
jgi:hypothetical protein